MTSKEIDQYEEAYKVITCGDKDVNTKCIELAALNTQVILKDKHKNALLALMAYEEGRDFLCELIELIRAQKR